MDHMRISGIKPSYISDPQVEVKNDGVINP